MARAVATSVLGPLIAVIVAVFSVPSIVGGIGLIKRWSWARYLVLILSVFSLTNVPVGTAMGVYSIWVLMHDETAELFAS
ncbi:MAG: hypothetical protein ISS56_13495 [Anaerolineae bacterium]|nr:hypothetical protein [Anaerolineae bacterium]